ncbi:MAG: class I SAM-dependent methyltransferase [Anaerolineales bacterium]|nr:class I SAM-dependent methyltransferase [Anaerolineales bacterium]
MLFLLIEQALALRQAQDNASRVTLFESSHESAFRLFNGFSEGYPDLTVDVYGRTFVIHNYAEDPASEQNQNLIQDMVRYLRTSLNWLNAGILKARNSKLDDEKNGMLIFGAQADHKIKEHGVWYALDLTMNRDASFYLDTSGLRKWLIENMQGKSVLNTFAYTGSFGVAALAGGASRVVQVDRNRKFLDLAKQSYALNGFSINTRDFIAQDFFPAVSRFKHSKQFFDCVILDPPFFSSTPKGKVDQEKESARLINKVRPLVNDGGYLVAINNALFVSGQEYMQTLEELCKDGYLEIAELIPVPQSFAGYEIVNKPITDPAPFNHSTKIAVLKVRRKK